MNKKIVYIAIPIVLVVTAVIALIVFSSTDNKQQRYRKDDSSEMSSEINWERSLDVTEITKEDKPFMKDSDYTSYNSDVTVRDPFKTPYATDVLDKIEKDKKVTTVKYISSSLVDQDGHTAMCYIIYAKDTVYFIYEYTNGACAVKSSLSLKEAMGDLNEKETRDIN